MEVYLARQPIFNRSKEIFGYELLFRDGLSNAFPDIDGDTASSKVLSNSFFCMGIDQITGGKKPSSILPRNCCFRKCRYCSPVKI